MEADLRAYKAWNKLKHKFPAKMIRLTTEELSAIPGMSGQLMRQEVSNRFKLEHNIEVFRWTHDYGSLNTTHPKLGLIYLTGDSVITETMEIWALVGHNAKGPDGAA